MTACRCHAFQPGVRSLRLGIRLRCLFDRPHQLPEHRIRPADEITYRAAVSQFSVCRSQDFPTVEQDRRITERETVGPVLSVDDRRIGPPPQFGEEFAAHSAANWKGKIKLSPGLL